MGVATSCKKLYENNRSQQFGLVNRLFLPVSHLLVTRSRGEGQPALAQMLPLGSQHSKLNLGLAGRRRDGGERQRFILSSCTSTVLAAWERHKNHLSLEFYNLNLKNTPGPQSICLNIKSINPCMGKVAAVSFPGSSCTFM